MATPTKGIAYEFSMGLVARASTSFVTNPTLATGDFQISKDGGAFANLATLPTVTPAGGKSVRVQLSATEMDADKIMIVASDQAGAEWLDASAFIDAPAANVVDHSAGNRTMDYDGDDDLGWQEVVYDEATGLVEVARYNLFDETDARIDETVAVFVARAGMIKTRTRVT